MPRRKTRSSSTLNSSPQKRRNAKARQSETKEVYNERLRSQRSRDHTSRQAFYFYGISGIKIIVETTAFRTFFLNACQGTFKS